jgi:Phage portal protein
VNLLSRMISGWIPSNQLPNINNLLPWVNIGGWTYPLGAGPQQTLGGKVEEITPGYTSLVERAYRTNPIVFACEMARMMLFTEARFQFQQMRSGRPGDYFGDRERPNSRLALLDHPWPGATTGDLLKYILTDADFAGTSFSYLHGMGSSARITRLRPDWVTMALGSYSDPDVVAGDPDADFLGVVYYPGGQYSGRDPVVIMANQIAIFAPIPDPLAAHRGMPWLMPVIGEIMGDQAASEHKLRYFEHGATPNLVVKVNEPDPKKFKEWTDLFTQNHSSVANAYKTIYLNPGADASILGSNAKDADLRGIQGTGEVRIANAAGVPATVVGLSEGLQGSSLNAGNFASSMRRFADLTMRPLWRNVAGSLENIVPAPTGARLWYDDRDIQALAEDQKDLADIFTADTVAIENLIRSGFEAESIIEAVTNRDFTLLKHTGLFSIQLQAPGSLHMPLGEVAPESPVGPGTKPVVSPQTPTKDQPNPDPTNAPGKAVPTVPAKAAATNGKGPRSASVLLEPLTRKE